MTNLTIAVDRDVVQRARIRALEQGTSVNRLLRDYLVAYSRAKEDKGEAVRRILAIADSHDTGSGGRTWTRDELHERG